MIAEAWERAILQAVDRYRGGDEIPIRLLASLLEQQDVAKSSLTEVFGCTGMPWSSLVEATITSYTDALAGALVEES